MNILNKSRFIFLLVLAALAAGCKTNPVNPSTVQNVTHTPGEFGYDLNGVSTDRKDYALGSTGTASLEPNWGIGVPANSKLLAINLMVEQISILSFHSTSIELYVPVVTPVPGTYIISKWGDAANANAAILNDSFEFDSKAGGTFVITKFDTVNNLISGTFSFDAALAKPNADPSKVDHVTSGYFNDIPIYIGSYGQGSVKANIDGFSFISQVGSLNSVSAYFISGLPQLNMIATGGDSTNIRQFYFTLTSPKIGDFNLSSATSAIAAASYGTSYSSANVSISTPNGATGKLTISNYDTTNHRISGTFNFSGTDSTSGKKIQITGGVIDNVQWFKL